MRINEATNNAWAALFRTRQPSERLLTTKHARLGTAHTQQIDAHAKMASGPMRAPYARLAAAAVLLALSHGGRRAGSG